MRRASKNKLSLGVCWYRKEQWDRLKEIVSDPDNIEDTYEAWRKTAQKTLQQFRRRGLNVQRVIVDVEDMRAWAKARKRPLDGTARSEYAGLLLTKGKR